MDIEERLRMALAVAGISADYVSASINETGKVRLTGIVQEPVEKLAAELAVFDVDGVESVENEITIAGM